MTATCSNPNCGVPLRSFTEGRLFHFEIASVSISAVTDSSELFQQEPETQVAQYWLCSKCADRMTLSIEPLNGLQFIPLLDLSEMEEDTAVELCGEPGYPATSHLC